MGPLTRVMLVGAVAVVAFDAAAALLAVRFGFSWGWAILGEALLYLVVGFCGGRVGGVGAGVRSGAVTAAADATAGWAVAWWIGPGRLHRAVPMTFVFVVLVMIAAGAVLGSVGGWGARLLAGRGRRTRQSGDA